MFKPSSHGSLYSYELMVLTAEIDFIYIRRECQERELQCDRFNKKTIIKLLLVFFRCLLILVVI